MQQALSSSAALVLLSAVNPLKLSALPAGTLVSRTFSTPRHTTHFIECGPADGPLMIFLHGWPEISLVWRAQMDAFAADGWHCVAPDLRGYGGSSAPAASDAYTIKEVVADLAELHDQLGGKPAIWVGHDWGSVVAGELAAHEPRRSRGVVLVSVPYFPDSNALPTLVPLVDRTIYPADQYPDGQWDYYRYYNTHFKSAVADLDADKAASLASIFRRADPASIGKPAANAMVTRKGGRFGAAHHAPPTQPDPALWPAADFDVLVQAFKAHGFRPACAWYLNDAANIAYARKAPNGGRLSQPVLFVNGDYDQMDTINGNRLGDPMRAACPDLTVTSLPGAHWLPLERKAELVQAIRTWLQSKKLSALPAGPVQTRGAVRPFQIAVPQAVLDDLQTRLARTRWPDEVIGAGWDYGTNLQDLQQLTEYWQHGYDWRAQEAKLNQFPQFKVNVEGSDLHFLRVEGKGPNPMPLLLTHGWPDSFFRFVKLIPRLTDPVRYGGRAEDAFTVVVPDIPGFGFSERPTTPGTDTLKVADLFTQLMTDVLGYKKFAAHGGDFGASVTEQIALRHPESLIAIQMLNVPPQHAEFIDPKGLSATEKAYLEKAKAWGKKEGGFTAIQTTKPQTLSYGLNDSPVGQCAWIVEKFYDWSDKGPDNRLPFTPDELLTNVMIYWVTQTGGSAARFYYEKAHDPAAPQSSYVTVPTDFVTFTHDISPAPREFAARFFNIQRWTEMPHGGHFAALEVPDALAGQVREFFRAYRKA